MNRLLLAGFVLPGLALLGCGGGQQEGPTRVTGKSAFERGDYAQALKELRPLAEQGDADAQFKIGFMYTHGRGVTRDDIEAVQWIRQAAEKGHAEAQYNLGLDYELGRGVPQDTVQAHAWFTLAAAQGYVAAQEMRDDTAQRMTEDQVSESRRLAAEWKSKM